MMIKRKLALISLGCSKNLVDSEFVLGMLLPTFALCTDYDLAEVIIINTCGFIEAAKKEAIATILEMAEYKEKGKCQKLIVMGCLAERYLKELPKELPEVDLFIPISKYSQLKTILNDKLDINLTCEFGSKRFLSTVKGTAYLKIADGCDNNCSYCAIPLIRKKYRSVPKEIVLKEAQSLSEQGVKELVLVAQDTTLYGLDLYGYLALGDLLSALNTIEGIIWIRVLYMYPDLVNKQLIKLMSELTKVLLYFDIPLQHANQRILKLMNRRGSIADFQDNISYLKSLNKPYALRTTMMVGFPGEEENDFKELLKLVQEQRFFNLGAFIYCPEEDTAAYSFKPSISKTLALKRYHELLTIQQKIAKENKQELIGTSLEVLVEKKVSSTDYRGRSFYQAPDDIDGEVIIYSKQELRIGEFYPIKITKVSAYDLYGEHI